MEDSFDSRASGAGDESITKHQAIILMVLISIVMSFILYMLIRRETDKKISELTAAMQSLAQSVASISNPGQNTTSPSTTP